MSVLQALFGCDFDHINIITFILSTVKKLLVVSAVAFILLYDILRLRLTPIAFSSIKEFFRKPRFFPRFLRKVPQSRFKKAPLSRFKNVSQSKFKIFSHSRLKTVPQSSFKTVPQPRFKKVSHSRFNTAVGVKL